MHTMRFLLCFKGGRVHLGWMGMGLEYWYRVLTCLTRIRLVLVYGLSPYEQDYSIEKDVCVQVHGSSFVCSACSLNFVWYFFGILKSIH